MQNTNPHTQDQSTAGYEISPRFPYQIGIYVRGNSDREIRSKAERIKALIEEREKRTPTGSVVAVFSDRKESWFHSESTGRLLPGWERLYNAVLAGKVKLVAMEEMDEIASNRDRRQLLADVITFFGADIVIVGRADGKDKPLQFHLGPASIKKKDESQVA